jgi:signal peptidase I
MPQSETPQSKTPSPAESADEQPVAADDSPAEEEADQPEQADQPDQSERRRGRSFLTEMAVLFVIALTIALLIKSFVVQPFFIPSSSMENTLLIGDKVLVNKLVYHVRPIQRGDIIVFNGDDSWNPPTSAQAGSHNPVARVYDDTLGALFRNIAGLFGTPTDQIDYIKRVIGLPGDHVACCNSKDEITVNGVALSEKSYLYPGNQPSQFGFKVTVPAGQLWVMGDHRIDSADSRLHDCAYRDPETCYPFDKTGTIPENKVIGRAFMIVWPPRHFRVLPIPATFEQARLLRSGTHPSAAATAAATSSLKAAELASSAEGIPLRPSAPYLPLALGFGFALPLTATERVLRVRLRARRRSARSARSARSGRSNG